MPPAEFSVAEAARRVDLSPHTLRYYERAGLLPRVARASGGQRRYTDADLEWLRFIRRLRDTGMPIRDIRRFAALRARGARSVPARQAMLKAHLATVLAQRARLDAAIRALRQKLTYYRSLAADA